VFKKGTVCLVGAGPGNPGLITLRGKECLESADVVIYDYLVNPELLKYAPEGAELISLGRKNTSERLPQDEINRLMVARALKGKTVVRLKSGDPFVFGRGGEEALALANANVEFEIVPGITAAVAVPEYAGIPLTHREYSSVIFLTGHESPEKPVSIIDWESISRIKGTLVFYMGIKTLPEIVRKLLSLGKSPDTPAAVINWGSLPEQKAVKSTLGRVLEGIESLGITSPSVLVVGEVVALSDRISWFEKKPLFGRTVMITRAEEQSEELAKGLRDLGARVLSVPMIKIVPAPDWKQVDRALKGIRHYNWIIFTSVNGVRFFFRRMEETKTDIRNLNGARIMAIGPRTAAEIRIKGINIDAVPDEYRAEAVVKLFGKKTKGLRILLPRAKVARDVIPVELRKLGARVDVLAVYETVLPDIDRGKLLSLFNNKEIDIVTFTSSSTVRNFVGMIGRKKILKILNGVTVACIGPVTSGTAWEYGIKTALAPAEYTMEGLIRAIKGYFSPDRK